MLKTISAALLAVSVIAAPAFAADSAKTTQTPAGKTDQAPAAKTTQAKPGTLNANAKMSRHTKHVSHHRSHKNKMSSLNTHKLSSKPAAPTTKRG